jgi:hypothetical protein
MRPLRIEHGNIMMLWGDCGDPSRPHVWTTEDWRAAVDPDGTGLFVKVGLWDFVPANDPAAGCIRFCNMNPGAAGAELYSLRKLQARLQKGGSDGTPAGSKQT